MWEIKHWNHVEKKTGHGHCFQKRPWYDNWINKSTFDLKKASLGLPHIETMRIFQVIFDEHSFSGLVLLIFFACKKVINVPKKA